MGDSGSDCDADGLGAGSPRGQLGTPVDQRLRIFSSGTAITQKQLQMLGFSPALGEPDMRDNA
jgi:hypothetical protein